MLQEIRFVLVRPGSGGNAGAAARALKNMGLRELWLVDPRYRDAGEAHRLAHGATDVLEAARRVGSLPEALADCRWSVGTTRRAGRRRGASLTPRTLAEAVRREPDRRPLAILFGPEEDGLSAADLRACHDLLRIPASPAQPSLNLGQAVMLVAYELFTAAHSSPRSGPASRTEPPEALADALEGMYAHLEEVLLEIGFARPDTAPHRMLAFRRMLSRSRLRPGDVRLVRGMCRQILWAVRRRQRRA